MLASLPTSFEEIYPWQIDAIDQIVEHYIDGYYKVVVLEAPTGSGKTLIAECVRRILKTRGVYVCHNKELQSQFGRSFPYARELYGRANYLPMGYKGLDRVTCDDCNKTADRDCNLCAVQTRCPYSLAKMDAVRSPVPILNSAYWLNEVMGERSRFKNTGLCILDEADTLENVLLGQVEIYIGERRQKKYGIKPPRKLTKDYLPWAEDTIARLSKAIGELNADSLDVKETRELRSLLGTLNTVSTMAEDLRRELPWVYTGGAGSSRRSGEVISFKPVKVERFGLDRIWSKDQRFLLMAALIPDITISSLGWTGPYKRVSIESQFHPKNRQVVVRPVADMTRKGLNEAGLRQLNAGIRSILGQQAGERVLVHCVSYALRGHVEPGLRQQRTTYTYADSTGRSRAIEGFKQTPASVLLAPGLERGVDLPDDYCRCQIILKVPFLSLGDKQVQERLYKTSDGQVWYNQHVATTILQMVGRGVRSKEDYCTCYILDSTFINWYKSWGHLLPGWFRKAIRVEY